MTTLTRENSSPRVSTSSEQVPVCVSEIPMPGDDVEHNTQVTAMLQSQAVPSSSILSPNLANICTARKRFFWNWNPILPIPII